MSYDTLFESVLSGVLTGGATAVTTVFGMFRETRKRIADLETRANSWDSRLSVITGKIGSAEAGTGIVSQLNKLRVEFDEQKNWILGLAPAYRPAMVTPHQSFIVPQMLPEPTEENDSRVVRIEKSLRDLRSRIEELESRVTDQEKALGDSNLDNSKDLHKLQIEIAGLNGLMRGLAVATGVIQPEELGTTKT